MTNLEDLAQKKSYSDEEFSFIVERSHQLTVSDEKEAEWSLTRLKRKVKCSSCEDFVLSGNLAGQFQKLTFHPYRVCLPRQISNIKAKAMIEISKSEEEDLRRNGVRVF